MNKVINFFGVIAIVAFIGLSIVTCNSNGAGGGKKGGGSNENSSDDSSGSSTSDTPISNVAISVTGPATGQTPDTVASGTGNFTIGAVTWSPQDNTFLPNTIYTASVTLTAAANNTFTGLASATLNGNNATITNNTGKAVTLSHTFVSTLASEVTGITILTQPVGLLTYTHGDTLDLSGLAVTINYSDSAAENVSFADFASKGISANPSNGQQLVYSAHNAKPVIVSLGTHTANTGDLTINQKNLSIIDLEITKTFDGANTVLGFGSLSFNGLANGETASVNSSGVTATYAGTLVGTHNITFIGDFTMTGGNANPADYKITRPTGVTGKITLASINTAPNQPGIANVTSNSVTLAAPTAGHALHSHLKMEYARNATTSAPASGWQDGLTFNGLDADATYYFFARYKADTTKNDVSPASAGLLVDTGSSPATVTGVVVTPNTATVTKGDTQQFNATVNGTNNPPQTVTWSVSGGLSSTISSSGLLTVAANESASTLTVTATSTYDTSKKGTATVNVANPPATVTSVVVTPNPATVTKGDTQQFNATVNGTNNPPQTVTWSVSGGLSSISSSGLLTVAANESASTLTVTATSTYDTSKKGTATVNVANPPATVTFSNLTANGDASTTTTQLTLTFSQAIAGLSLSDITLSGTTGATKATLSGTGPAYTLTINNVTSSGDLTVAVAKSGYNITNPSRTVPIYYATSVTFSNLTANGNATTTTTQLTLTFSQAIAGLSLSDITLSGTTGATKGALSGTGPAYTLTINNVTSSGDLTVAVAKSGYNITNPSRTVPIYYAAPATYTVSYVGIPYSASLYTAYAVSNIPSTQTKTHNVALTLSGLTPTKWGYTFAGWSTTSPATAPATVSYQPNSSFTTNANTTLYAVWQVGGISVSYFEMETVDEMNFARTKPQEYLNARLVPNRWNYWEEDYDECAALLRNLSPMAALVPEKGLFRSAKAHVEDMRINNYLGHTGLDGSSPLTRMQRYGVFSGWPNYGENLAYGYGTYYTVKDMVLDFIVDDDCPPGDKGHRAPILNSTLTQIGVGFGPHPSSYGSSCVLNFASGYTSNPGSSTSKTGSLAPPESNFQFISPLYRKADQPRAARNPSR